jgi:hypothetical protein
MVALLETEFDVLRVKNRFADDEVEEVSAERLQAEFFRAETLGEDISLSDIVLSADGSAPADKSENMYRDVLLNLRPKGSDFVCEVQLTLTGISILKKSEQKIYTIARMVSAEELQDTYVFSRHPGAPDDSGPAETTIGRGTHAELSAPLMMGKSFDVPSVPIGNERYANGEDDEREPLSPKTPGLFV